MFAGDAYQFLQSTPPLRLTLLAPQTCSEFSVPLAERTWTEPAQWAQWVLCMRRIPAASAASDLCGTIMSAGGVSICGPMPIPFKYERARGRIRNKTKQKPVRLGMIWLRSLLLGFCLFMRTFCAGQTFHILCQLPARCFVYLHSHTHTVGESHTLIAHHRHLLLPRSSAHLSTQLVLA